MYLFIYLNTKNILSSQRVGALSFKVRREERS